MIQSHHWYALIQYCSTSAVVCRAFQSLSESKLILSFKKREPSINWRHKPGYQRSYFNISNWIIVGGWLTETQIEPIEPNPTVTFKPLCFQTLWNLKFLCQHNDTIIQNTGLVKPYGINMKASLIDISSLLDLSTITATNNQVRKRPSTKCVHITFSCNIAESKNADHIMYLLF